jgi:hypothetical protein
MATASNRSSGTDLFSSLGGDTASSSRSSFPTISHPTKATLSSRLVLPKDLNKAIKELSDEELEQLITAALEERTRRKKISPTKEIRRNREIEPTLHLPLGKLNAVRAAFKAGITPNRIAREFGISQSDVRKALAGDATKR